MARIVLITGMWAFILWRAPGAYRQRERRALWASYCGLALCLTTDMPQVASAIDTASTVPNLATLVNHLASVLACAAVLECVIALASPPRHLARILAYRYVLTGGAMAALGVLFACLPRVEAGDFVDSAAGHPAATAYEAVQLSYVVLATACSCATYAVAWHRTRGAHLTRTGFALLAVGGWSIALGAAVRLAFLATALDGITGTRTDDAAFKLSNMIEDGAVLLGLTGIVLPKILAMLRTRRDLIALRPLWHELTAGQPGAVLTTPSSRDDRFDPRLLDLRLLRRVFEIRDAMAALYRRCEIDPTPLLGSFAFRPRARGARRDALLEAATIEYALTRREAPAPIGTDAVTPWRGGGDYRAEIAWLRAVAKARTERDAMNRALDVVQRTGARRDRTLA